MFWGLTLKPNRKYTQVTSKPFHISLAALDSTGEEGDVLNRIYLNCDDERFLICTLRNGTCDQVPLDMNFEEGEKICFQTIGNGKVSLSGYIIAESDVYENGDGEYGDNYELADLRDALTLKSKAQNESTANTVQNHGGVAEEDDEEEDDSDFEPPGGTQGTSEDDDSDEEIGDEEEDEDDDEDEDSEDDDEESEEDESDEDVAEQPKAKQPKLEKTQSKENGAAKQSAAAAVQENKGNQDKKNKKDKKQNQQPEQKKAGGERTLTGGVKIEDIRVGNGPEAKPKKKVQVYYEGRLKNNKVFDSMKQGSGFKFKLDNGDVIKAWDVGIVGMKVGGKRRIICPPHMAYGSRGSPPAIPPNATLVFEVELKSVS